MSSEAKCPISGGAHKHTVAGATANADWWPNQLNLKILHQHSAKSNPMGEAFNYAESFNLLLRPCEVSSRIAHAAILKVADDAFGALLKHRHMFIGSVA